MKGLSLFIVSLLFFHNIYGQIPTIKDLLSMSSLSQRKFIEYISKKNFVAVGRDWQNDTIVNIYRMGVKKELKDSLPVTRVIETYQSDKGFSFAFQTSSRIDYSEAKKDLIDEGFFCGNEDDPAAVQLYQRKNISIQVQTQVEPDDTLYTFHFHEKELPPLSKIRLADDLLHFGSHEYLVSVFGEKNVKKDIYYFSEKEIAKCSVLFPYTKRQAVFIWNDEVNRSGLSSVLIGGNLNTESSLKYDHVIGENGWISKDGVYSGMSLNNLVKLNGKGFRFYGKNSAFPLMVVPENSGSVNFKKNIVVLACLSVSSSKLLNKETVDVSDVLKDNPDMYVFMYMLSPSKEEE